VAWVFFELRGLIRTRALKGTADASNFTLFHELIMLLAKQGTEDMGMRVRIMIDMSKAEW